MRKTSFRLEPRGFNIQITTSSSREDLGKETKVDKKSNIPGFLVLIAAIVLTLIIAPRVKKASQEGQAHAAKVSWHLYWAEGKEIKHAEIQRGCKPLHGNFTFKTKEGKELVISQETTHLITNIENPRTKELFK